MIIEKPDTVPQSLPNAPNDPDAPPSYDTAVIGSSPSSNGSTSQQPLTTSRLHQPTINHFPLDEKTYLKAPSSPSNSRAGESSCPTSPRAPSVAKSPAGWLGNFLGTPQARGDQEVKQTVLSLLRDLVKQNDDAIAITILHSCAEACIARGLSFEAIVQEPSIQGHTPLYWAIVKQAFASPSHSVSSQGRPIPASDRLLGQPTLFDSLVSYPFSKESYADALQACLLTSSHDTFLQLRHHDPSRTEDLLGLDPRDAEDGPTSRPRSDIVEVSNGDDQSNPEENAMSGAFRVKLMIRDFQRRVRVHGGIQTEFIARGRMWSLSFLVYSQSLAYPVNLGRSIANGAWIVLLDLVHNSPPTWIDSRLTITVPAPSDTQPTVSANPFAFSSISTMGNNPNKYRPTPIVLRFRSPGNNQLSGEMKDKCKSWDNSRGPVVVSLYDHPQAGSLQYDGCPYIQSDGSLHMVFEAKLIKPGNECVFM